MRKALAYQGAHGGPQEAALSATQVAERIDLTPDVLVSRLPPAGKKVCLVLGRLVMLYTTWLLFSGSLAQARINWDVEAPVTGASVAIFYASGVVFSVCAGVLLLLQMLRESGSSQKVMATAGQLQQNLPQGRTFQLLRLKIDPSLGITPEISCNRLLVVIRMMRQQSDGKLVATTDDVPFEMALCA